MKFEEIYCPNPDFCHRYIAPEKLFEYLQRHFKENIECLGYSTQKRPIYKVQLGTGAVSVLAWSQMHGNESNATHAMLDLWYTLSKNPDLLYSLFSKITLDFVFMLNPDGSHSWNRFNADDIDLNRDFHAEKSVEIPFLKQLAFSKKYDFALNLHEQRTIFTTDGVHPATLSFLSPSEGADRAITENRKKIMAFIVYIKNKINPLLPNGIGRYSDEYYPNSTGDNFMKLGLPTLLFEGGHYPNDYSRKYTRMCYTIALYYALEAMADCVYAQSDWQGYLEIPENMTSHYDLIYRNVKVGPARNLRADIGVQYREIKEPQLEDITLVPIVAQYGDLSDKKGWVEIDCSNKNWISERNYPKVDEIVTFRLED